MKNLERPAHVPDIPEKKRGFSDYFLYFSIVIFVISIAFYTYIYLNHNNDSAKVVMSKGVIDDLTPLNSTPLSEPSSLPSPENIKGRTLKNKREKININTATVEELMTLPDIEERQARDIIKYREANGKFHKKSELLKVTSVTEYIYKRIYRKIKIRDRKR